MRTQQSTLQSIRQYISFHSWAWVFLSRAWRVHFWLHRSTLSWNLRQGRSKASRMLFLLSWESLGIWFRFAMCRCLGLPLGYKPNSLCIDLHSSTRSFQGHEVSHFRSTLHIAWSHTHHPWRRWTCLCHGTGYWRSSLRTVLRLIFREGRSLAWRTALLFHWSATHLCIASLSSYIHRLL